MVKSESIKIQFLPILGIFLFVFLFVVAGFVWNGARLSQKLTTLETHTADIYKANASEFISLASSDDLEQIKNVLKNINEPEQGIYQIDLIVKKDNKWIYYNNYGQKQTIVSDSQMQKISDSIHLSSSGRLKEDLFRSLYFDEGIYGINTIEKDGQIIGYVLVRLAKNKNI